MLWRKRVRVRSISLAEAISSARVSKRDFAHLHQIHPHRVVDVIGRTGGKRRIFAHNFDGFRFVVVGPQIVRVFEIVDVGHRMFIGIGVAEKAIGDKRIAARRASRLWTPATRSVGPERILALR